MGDCSSPPPLAHCVPVHAPGKIDCDINSMTPGSYVGLFKDVISKHMLWIKLMGPYYETCPRCMPDIYFDHYT